MYTGVAELVCHEVQVDERVVNEFIEISACRGGLSPYRRSYGCDAGARPGSLMGTKRRTVELTEITADVAFPVPSSVSAMRLSLAARGVRNDHLRCGVESGPCR